MHKILLIIAFLGLLVSGYLLFSYVTPVPLICGSDGGCSVVQASKYASFLSLPTPLYGVIYYLALGLLAALWKPAQTTVAWMMVFVTGTGFAVSAWLTYLEAFVIQAWCAWCVVSAILATAAFVVTWLQTSGRPNTIE